MKQSQYSTPVFIISRKEVTVRSITDYHRVNQKFVRNLYLPPRTSKTMQKMEGFQYAITLYLSMVYHIIRLSPTSQDMKKIVTEFGKVKYNRLPMGMWASGDIFQAKVDKIIGDIDGFKTNTNDILVLSKEILSKQTEQLRIIFGILRTAGLKINAPK